MILEFQQGENNPILRKKSEEISKPDSKLKKFLKEMEKEMTRQNGVGLAAPQVGHNIRAIIVRLNAGTKEEMTFSMINPEILQFSEEKYEDEEGCLSIPDIWGIIERPKEIIVSFQNPRGAPQTLKLSTLNARIVQHEIDHLDGILFIDRAKNTYKKEKNQQSIA